MAGNTNYLTGFYTGEEYRPFFTFNVASLNLTGLTVTGADLNLHNENHNGTSSGIFLNPVSTPAGQLSAGGPANPTIFADLGNTGAYGVSFYTATANTISFPLTSAAGSDIAAAYALGNPFSVGLSIQGSNYAFGSMSTLATLSIYTTGTVAEPSWKSFLGHL